MKKQKRLMMWIVGVFLMLFSTSSWAQVPIYTCRISGAAQPTCNEFEFDVQIQRNGSNIFKLAQFQLAININPAIIPPGGIINVAPVPGSSTLTNAAQIPGVDRFAYLPATNCIQVTPVSPPGSAAASTIVQGPAAWTKLMRIRVACSLPWVAGEQTMPSTIPTWSFSLSTGYQTKIFAYVGVENTDVTVPTSHTLVNPYNLTLTNSGAAPIAQTVNSDVTEVCLLPGAGAVISLASTQSGYTYYLYQDGNPVLGPGGVVFGQTGGTAANNTFATKVTGSLIEVMSPSCSGMVPMANTITLTPTSPVTPSVSIAAFPGTGNLPGTPVTVTATPVDPATIDMYVWYLNGVFDENQFGPTFDFTPANGDQVYCEMYSSGCITPAAGVVTSNTLIFSASLPPAVFNVTGTGAYCQGGTGLPVGLDGSEVGVTYTLTPGGATLPGTGGPISFGNQLAGTYTIDGTNGGGTTPMSGSAIITETANVAASVAILTSQNNFCSANPSDNVLFTAIPTNGGTSPSYVWYINGGQNGGNGDSYTFNVSNGDVVTVEMTSSETCVTGSPASDAVTMVINAQVTPTFAQLGPYCQGATPDALPAMSIEGITGTWDPAAISTTGFGTFTYTFTPTPGLCASEATMVVLVNESSFATPDVIEICSTETPFSWHGGSYSTSNIYQVTENCVTYTLMLTVNQSSTEEFTAGACDTYTWALNGQTYTASGDYTYVDGCVTNILHLTITPSSTVEFTAGACDTYTWALNGQTYTASGDYTYVDGCVTNILHLTITNSSTEEFTASACDTYTWGLNGQTYTASGDYTYVDGCVTNILHLTITQSSTVEFTAGACDTYTWALNGQTYTASGDYTYVDGCVTNILHLTVTPSGTNEFTISECDSYTWALNGQTYTASGDYTFVNVCSTNILHLTITPSSTVEFTASNCDSYFWALNGQTYTVSGDYTYVVGCVTNILHLTVTPSSTVEFTAGACDTYTWALNGQTYTVSGDYTYVDGCVTNILHLTITPSSTVEFTAGACDSYTWALNGQTYTASGDYTYVDGCVTNILHLTITPGSTVEVTDAACDSYFWALNGQTYTASGDYTYLVGCVTNILHLTITPSSTVNETVAVFGSYTWPVNGVTYTVSGDYTVVTGCVTHILHLTINTISAITFAKDIGTTLQILWPAVPGATTYEVSYRIGNSGAWIGKNSVPTNAKISNLIPGQAYNFRVKAYAGIYPMPASTLQYASHTTTNVAYTEDYDIGTTLLVGWNDFDASSYVLQYKKGLTGTWAPIVSYIPEVKLSNLDANSDYFFRVAVYYGGQFWGTTKENTLPYHTGITDFVFTNITATSVDVTWDSYLPWVTDQHFIYSDGITEIGVPAHTFNTLHLTGLTPGTNYTCRVNVFKTVNWGPTISENFVTAGTKATTDAIGGQANVYPNPFVDQVNMDLFTEDGAQVTWNIYDITGKVVLSGSESITTGYSTLNIDAANLAKGVYMLNAIINDQMQSFRILKQ